MGKIQATQQSYAADWNFAADGGAIGTILLSSWNVPQNSRLLGIRFDTLTALTAAGGTAAISFGFQEQGVAAPITDVTAFLGVNNFAAFNQVNAAGRFITIPGNCNPINFPNAWLPLIAISGAALTAGRIVVTFECSIVNNV